MASLRTPLVCAGLATAATVGTWATQAFGPPISTHDVGRWIAPLWLASLGWWAASWTRSAVVAADAPSRRRWIAASLLLALALAVRVAGIDHEVGERAYLDEGTYVHHAREINDGNPWRWSFVYGHVSYYAGAFGLWLSELYPDLFEAVAAAWSGTDEALAHQWLVLRLLVALLSALTVLPVFGMARRIWAASGFDGDRRDRSSDRGGLAAGILAGALFVFSPLFNEGSHLIISDYPSACLAAFCLYFVLRIAEQPTARTPPWRHLCAAGAFAGLAAATKYPAGTVAVAIVFVWALGIWSRRQLRALDLAALATAAGVSMAAFVGSMPTFLRDPVHAVTAPRGMLFGLNQYAEGGWIGVMPSSQTRYYLELSAEAVGWVALLLIAAAPFLLPRGARRLWWIAAFYPAAYLGLLLSMNMVVKRNLAPAVPMLAVLSGVGAVAMAVRCAPHARQRQRLFAAVGLILMLQPAWSTAQQVVGFSRDSTREHALRWMIGQLPEGTRVLRESYTPRLPPDHFFLRRARFAARVPPPEIERDGYEYVLLARNAFQRFLDEENHTERHHGVMQQRYLDMFERYPEVRRFEPTRWRRGPTLILLRVVPGPGVEVRPVPYDTATESSDDEEP